MSRIPLVEPEAAPPEVQAIYKDIQAEGMDILNVLKMFGNNQHFLAGMLQMIRGLYSDRSKLSPRYRELAYLRASQLNSCHY
jgi:alkylhydroperoxidase family enzyme